MARYCMPPRMTPDKPGKKQSEGEINLAAERSSQTDKN